MEFTRDLPDKEGCYFVKCHHETSPVEIVRLEYFADNKAGFTAQDIEEDPNIEECCWYIWRHELNSGDSYYYREDFLWGERIEMP